MGFVGKLELWVSSEKEALKYIKEAVSKFKEEYKPLRFEKNKKGVRWLRIKMYGKEYPDSSFYYLEKNKKERVNARMNETSLKGVLGIDICGLNLRIAQYLLKKRFDY